MTIKNQLVHVVMYIANYILKFLYLHVPYNYNHSCSSIAYCIQRPSTQKTLLDAYKEDCKWFLPIELIRRILLVIFIIIEPRNLVSDIEPLLKIFHICIA